MSEIWNEDAEKWEPCPATREAVEEMEERGEMGCPLCAAPAYAHQGEGWRGQLGWDRGVPNSLDSA